MPKESGSNSNSTRSKRRSVMSLTSPDSMSVGWTPGMHLSDALRLAGGIKPDAYLQHILISRLRPSDSVRVQLRAALRDASGSGAGDIALSDDDEIRIFSTTEFRSTEYVIVAVPFCASVTPVTVTVQGPPPVIPIEPTFVVM